MRRATNKRPFHRRHLYRNADFADVMGWTAKASLRFLRRARVALVPDGRNFKVTREDVVRVLGAQAPHVLAELDSNYE